VSERSKRVSTGERTVDEWDRRPGLDNDLFDVVVGMYVAASVRGLSLDITNKGNHPTKAKRISLAEVQRAAQARRAVR
jgi:hypothetical protein